MRDTLTKLTVLAALAMLPAAALAGDPVQMTNDYSVG